MRAALERNGRLFEITGKLTGTFLIENGRVLVRLNDVAPFKADDDQAARKERCDRDEPSERVEWDALGERGGQSDWGSLWVDARSLKALQAIVLRSEIWEIPDGQERDVVLRSLSVALADQVSRHSYRIDLAKEHPGILELLFYNEVVLEQGPAYQASFAPIRLRCRPRPLPWRPPTHIVASKTPTGKDRYQSHVGHLPLWLEASKLWSAYLWHEGRLIHVLQFSLHERLRRTLETRFRMKPAAGPHHLP